jgi:hypothetical protein
MDPNEIFEYINESIKWLVIAGGSYLGALFCTQLIFQTTLFRRKIHSQTELEEIVGIEAKKLGLDTTSINARFDVEGYVKKDGKKHELCIRLGVSGTDATVRHELYHIFKKDTDYDLTILRYFLLAEPRATLYGCFGIKL